MSGQFHTTILIPGPWADRKDILVAIANRKKCLFGGFILMGIKNKTVFKASLIQDWSAEDYFKEFAPLFPAQAEDEKPLSTNANYGLGR